MFIGTWMGMVSATTRPPISRARRAASSWRVTLSALFASVPRTFQFSGHQPVALMRAKRSISSSVNLLRQPSTIASRVVPSYWLITSHKARTSSTDAHRLGTATPSPSLWVDD